MKRLNSARCVRKPSPGREEDVCAPAHGTTRGRVGHDKDTSGHGTITEDDPRRVGYEGLPTSLKAKGGTKRASIGVPLNMLCSLAIPHRVGGARRSAHWAQCWLTGVWLIESQLS